MILWYIPQYQKGKAGGRGGKGGARGGRRRGGEGEEEKEEERGTTHRLGTTGDARRGAEDF